MTSDVTIIILAYNDPLLVKRAIESALNQTYQNIKVKLLDNGSTDSTPRVLADYKRDARVEIITNRVNQRSEFATRVAMNVETEFLCFLFSDDYYELNRVETMLSVLKKNVNAAAVFSNNYFVDDSGLELDRIPTTVSNADVTSMNQDEHLAHFFTAGNSLHPCSMLIRTKAFKDLGGFPPFLHRIGDMTFFLRLLSRTNVLFMRERLQRITVLTSNRNESYANAINRTAVAYERTQFLRECDSDDFLRKLENVFPELKEKIAGNQSRDMRLFWLGWRIFQIPTLDHKLFGMDRMYQAYGLAPSKVNEACLQFFGNTFSQICFEWQQTHISKAAVRAHKLRLWVINLPGGKLIIDTLRPLVKSLRAGVSG